MTSININKEKFGQLMHKEKPVFPYALIVQTFLYLYL